MGDALATAVGGGIAPSSFKPGSLTFPREVVVAKTSLSKVFGGDRLLLASRSEKRDFLPAFNDRALGSTLFLSPTTSGRSEWDYTYIPTLQRPRCVGQKRRSIIANAAKTMVGSISVNTAETVAASLAKSSVVPGEVLLAAEGLAKTFDGDRYLFQDLNLTVAQGQKIGLIGQNGSGKTTLLRILAGAEKPDQGSVQRRKQINVGFLEQEPAMDGDSTLLEAVISADTPLMAAVRAYEKAAAGMAKGNGAASDKRFQAAMESMDALQAWDVASEARQLLDVLGVGFYDQRVSDLSGGQKKRVALAAALLAKPDLLVLDEPTNHMDVEAIEWMERLLGASSLTVLLVTHDRYFLDRVSNEIVEISAGRAYSHSGNYSAYLANKALREVSEEAAISKAETILRKETEWMRRQPKARSTKSRARIDQYHALTKAAERKGPTKGLQLEIGSERLGKKILELRGACMDYGALKVLDNFSYTFVKGDRVGVVGRNGVGKSTLLEAFAGNLALKSGEREAGETLNIGYYTQDTPAIPDDVRVMDYCQQFAEGEVQLGRDVGGFLGNTATTGDRPALNVSGLLERFGFPRAKQYDRACKLSGGERRRLHLATVLIRRPNFLMMDEPTNDLDLQTIETLEAFLQTWDGCLVVVSHDRAFMDSVVDWLLVMEGDGKVRAFEGSYSEYIEVKREERLAAQVDEERAQAAESAAAAAAVAPSSGSAKLTYNEKKEYGRLEKEIEKLTSKREQLEGQLDAAQQAGDFDKLAKLGADVATLMAQIDAKSDRWLELAERAEG